MCIVVVFDDFPRCMKYAFNLCLMKSMSKCNNIVFIVFNLNNINNNNNSNLITIKSVIVS